MAIQIVSTFRLLEQCCCEDGCTSFCEDILLFLLGLYLRVKLLGHNINFKLPPEEEPDCFSMWLHHFKFHHECVKDFSTSFITFVILFDILTLALQ